MLWRARLRGRRGEWLPPRFGGTGVFEQSVEVEFGGLLLVLDAEEFCGLLGFGQRAGDDDGDGLAAVEDVGVLEDVDVAGYGEFGALNGVMME